jgi:hypothetical protein
MTQEGFFMKRTLFALLTVATVATVAAPAMAADDVRWGVGYFRSEAPVGVRAWINPKLAIDAGIGFENKDFPYTENGSTVSDKKTSFTFDAGVPIVLAGDETTKFYVRPGIAFMSTPNWDYGDEKWVSSTEFWVSGDLGVEHWFGKHFSLGAGHGLIFKSVDPGTKGSDTTSGINTEAFGISNIGFHFYFK